MKEEDSFRLFSEEAAGAFALLILAILMLADSLGYFAR